MTTAKLLKLANKIKDKKLRQQVIEILKHPKLTNPKFKYKAAELKDTPASLEWHHTQSGGLVQHTLAVTEMSIEVARILEKIYNVTLDLDSLIAAALVHDIGKLWRMQKKKNWVGTEITLDHTMLGTAELYARGFPEHVVHIVASHFGDQSPTPPQTTEALILHTIDNMDAVLGGVKQEDVLKLLLGK